MDLLVIVSQIVFRDSGVDIMQEVIITMHVIDNDCVLNDARMRPFVLFNLISEITDLKNSC